MPCDYSPCQGVSFQGCVLVGQTVAAAMIAAAARSTDLSARLTALPTPAICQPQPGPDICYNANGQDKTEPTAPLTTRRRRGESGCQRQPGRGAGPLSAATRDDLLVAVPAVSPEQAVTEAGSLTGPSAKTPSRQRCCSRFV